MPHFPVSSQQLHSVSIVSRAFGYIWTTIFSPWPAHSGLPPSWVYHPKCPAVIKNIGTPFNDLPSSSVSIKASYHTKTYMNILIFFSNFCKTLKIFLFRGANVLRVYFSCVTLHTYGLLVCSLHLCTVCLDCNMHYTKITKCGIMLCALCGILGLIQALIIVFFFSLVKCDILDESSSSVYSAFIMCHSLCPFFWSSGLVYVRLDTESHFLFFPLLTGNMF